MSTFSNYCFATLLGMAVLSSCSRPVAYFQPGQRNHFSTQPQRVVTVESQEAAKPSIEGLVASDYKLVTSESVVQAQQAVSQLEAYVRNDTKLASNRKLTKRLERMHEVMKAANEQSLTSAPMAKAKQTTVMERVLLKKMDKRIKHQLAPDQPKAMNSNVRLGIIIGAIGLLLLIIGSGFLSVLGIIGLVVGIVLIILGYLNS